MFLYLLIGSKWSACQPFSGKPQPQYQQTPLDFWNTSCLCFFVSTIFIFTYVYFLDDTTASSVANLSSSVVNISNPNRPKLTSLASSLSMRLPLFLSPGMPAQIPIWAFCMSWFMGAFIRASYCHCWSISSHSLLVCDFCWAINILE